MSRNRKSADQLFAERSVQDWERNFEKIGVIRLTSIVLFLLNFGLLAAQFSESEAVLSVTPVLSPLLGIGFLTSYIALFTYLERVVDWHPYAYRYWRPFWLWALILICISTPMYLMALAYLSTAEKQFRSAAKNIRENEPDVAPTKNDDKQSVVSSKKKETVAAAKKQLPNRTVQEQLTYDRWIAEFDAYCDSIGVTTGSAHCRPEALEEGFQLRLPPQELYSRGPFLGKPRKKKEVLKANDSSSKEQVAKKLDTGAIDSIERLNSLKRDGAITEAEYLLLKKKVLDEM